MRTGERKRRAVAVAVAKGEASAAAARAAGDGCCKSSGGCNKVSRVYSIFSEVLTTRAGQDGAAEGVGGEGVGGV